MNPLENGTKVRSIWNSEAIKEPARDFRYLLHRGYPRKAALELVGNRYQLTYDERHLLHRGVFSREDFKSRRKKILPMRKIRNRDLAIDGYNVIITIEAGLSDRPLILADDGFIRDISGLSRSFRKSQKTEEAIGLIFDVLKKWRPARILFLFDAPISKSGRLAQEVRGWMEKEGLHGDARAIDVPEKVLVGFPGIVATSDTAIIDKSEEVIDLAGYIVRQRVLRLKPCMAKSHHSPNGRGCE